MPLLPPANEVAGRLCFYRCVWFCSQGGVHGCCGGACVVALGGVGAYVVAAGGHGWLLGACMVALGGMCGCCGGHAWLLWRHVWLLLGGMCGCSRGVRGCCWGHVWLLLGWGVRGCYGGMFMVAPGGHVWLLQAVGMHGCSGGCAWLLLGGACVVAPGGMRGCSGGQQLSSFCDILNPMSPCRNLWQVDRKIWTVEFTRCWQKSIKSKTDALGVDNCK